MSTSHVKIADVLRRDSRYAYPAYLFIFEGLEFTQERFDREDESEERHVTGPEMIIGVCELAQREFGLLARTVFRLWGIQTTDDVGEIVFNLIEAGLLSKTESDDRCDFHDVVDLDKALTDDYEISMAETPWAKQRGDR